MVFLRPASTQSLVPSPCTASGFFNFISVGPSLYKEVTEAAEVVEMVQYVFRKVPSEDWNRTIFLMKRPRAKSLLKMGLFSHFLLKIVPNGTIRFRFRWNWV
jgi:hypothetical protein